jgi:hypothetical protein
LRPDPLLAVKINGWFQVGDWLLEQELSILARLAVDGKTLRGSARTDGKTLQLLSAVTPERKTKLPTRQPSTPLSNADEMALPHCRKLATLDSTAVSTGCYIAGAGK